MQNSVTARIRLPSKFHAREGYTTEDEIDFIVSSGKALRKGHKLVSGGSFITAIFDDQYYYLNSFRALKRELKLVYLSPRDRKSLVIFRNADKGITLQFD